MKIPCTLLVQGIHKNNALNVSSTKNVQNNRIIHLAIMYKALPLLDNRQEILQTTLTVAFTFIQ